MSIVYSAATLYFPIDLHVQASLPTPVPIIPCHGVQGKWTQIISSKGRSLQVSQSLYIYLLCQLIGLETQKDDKQHKVFLWRGVGPGVII